MQLISTFVFITYIVQPLYFLNPKFQASSHLLWPCSLFVPYLVTPKTCLLVTRFIWCHMFAQTLTFFCVVVTAPPSSGIVSITIFLLLYLDLKWFSLSINTYETNGPFQSFALVYCQFHLSRLVRKPAFCICDNKDADQLRGNREADQRLCFRYTDSTIPLLPKSEISSL